MSEGIPYADIIILALIAGFILLRLRSVLGQNVGHENPDFFKKMQAPDQDAEQEPIIKLAEKMAKTKEPEQDEYLQSLKDESIKTTLADIRAKDPEFNASGFLSGAKMAFEMIFDGFAKGDKAPLKMLLSPELFSQFEKEIDERAVRDTKTETTLVSVVAKEIIRATLSGSTARLTVSFSSEQVSVVRDKDGKITEGNPSDVDQVIDEWTFERDITSRSPNWTIIDT
ncbi:MAG: Tim44/TimA family putative adaptor protein [Rickettsiales bacterium]|nr:Tim44/TimA family putative adaptor protein [Rickettsiales bacterium]